LDYHKILSYSAGVVGVGIASVVFVYACRYFISREDVIVTTEKFRSWSKRFFTVDFLVLLAKMSALSLFCFVMNCLFYYYLCDVVLAFHIRPADFFNANAALSLANYVSILTPGVPGGIGIKESVSILLISAYGYPRESLVMSILVFRLVCLLGDVFPFFIVKLLDANSESRVQ
jgi:uncharacterized membrane protein YbhN (UPF0104 family)